MGDNTEHIWILPLIGGIVALIGLLTPAASVSILYNSVQVWMWGLFSIRQFDYLQLGYITTTRFTQSPVELIISISATLLVFSGALGLVSSANSSRKTGITGKKWITPSILLIVGALVWIIGIEISTQIDVGMSFWEYINPGFGVIGPFLGAILSLIGYAAAKMSPKRPKEVITLKESESLAPYDYSQVPHSFKFCPDCGEKVVDINQQFCVNCGFNFKSFPTSLK